MNFVIICLLLTFFVMGSGDSIGSFVAVLVRSVIGGGILWCCQMIGVGLGLNVVNVMVLGFLGVPGFVGLISLGILL